MSTLSPFRTDSFRLTALLTAFFTAVIVTLMYAMYHEADTSLNANFIQTVRNDIAAIERIYENQGQAEIIEVIEQLTPERRPGQPRLLSYYLLQGEDGTKIAGNLPEMRPVFATTSMPPPPGTPNAAEHIIVGEGKTLPDKTYLFVGADSYWLIEAHEHILSFFAWITAGAVALTLGAGFLLSIGFARRIDRIVTVCKAVGTNQWDTRVPPETSGSTTALLGSTINIMLDRVASLMDNLRQVSSDIAHDLRTPLTHLRNRLEEAQATAQTVEEFRAANEHALQSSEEMLAIFSALLSMSQIEAGAATGSLEEVRLSELINHLIAFYQPAAGDQQQILVPEITPGIALRGDRALLMQMFANLIENGIRHNGPGGIIKVGLRRQAGNISAFINDNGPGIPTEHREKAFQRFWRGEESRHLPGNGLGLALVAAIAAMHKIKIELKDNHPGLSVTLTMTADANP